MCVLLIINAVLYNWINIHLTLGNKKCECFDNINAVFIWVVLEILTMPSNHRIVTIELHVIHFLILLGTLVS